MEKNRELILIEEKSCEKDKEKKYKKWAEADVIV